MSFRYGRIQRPRWGYPLFRTRLFSSTCLVLGSERSTGSKRFRGRRLDIVRWNIRHVAFLVEAAQQGSIAAAAQVLGVSQAAVNAAINNVEDALHVRIFLRQPGRGLSLTPAGTSLVEEARLLLDQARKFEETAALLSVRLSGTIRVGCFPTAAPHVMPPILQAMKKRYPAISIDLREDTLAGLSNQLKCGTIDVALTYDLMLGKGLHFEKLFEVCQRVAVANSDEMQDSDSVSLFDLTRKPLILLDLPECRERIVGSFERYGLRPNISFQTGSTHIIQNLVASGQGYAILAFSSRLGPSGEQEKIRYLRLREYVPPIAFGLVLPDQKQSSRLMSAFTELVREILTGWSVD